MLLNHKVNRQLFSSIRRMSNAPNNVITCFSGIQPTGIPHLGNYFGAIDRWVKLQDEGKSNLIVSIVDLHSLTTELKKPDLNGSILRMAAILLACGIDPQRTVFFQQSAVTQHAELGWILGCATTMARLHRLPHFKEKTSHLKEVPVGLFVYPVLQAADILLYRATHVPTGDDQVQNIQLAQQLAHSFNNKFKSPIFPRLMPMSAVDLPANRLLSLRDATKKMSKSDPDPRSRIELIDDPETIRLKFRKALADSESRITYEVERRPAVANLIHILSLVRGLGVTELQKDIDSFDTVGLKSAVAEATITRLEPIRREYERLMEDRFYLVEVLASGALRAREIAEKTMDDVRKVIGLAL